MMRRKVGKLLGDRRVVGGFLMLIQLAIVIICARLLQRS